MDDPYHSFSERFSLSSSHKGTEVTGAVLKVTQPGSSQFQGWNRLCNLGHTLQPGMCAASFQLGPPHSQVRTPIESIPREPWFMRQGTFYNICSQKTRWPTGEHRNNAGAPLSCSETPCVGLAEKCFLCERPWRLSLWVTVSVID